VRCVPTICGCLSALAILSMTSEKKPERVTSTGRSVSVFASRSRRTHTSVESQGSDIVARRNFITADQLEEFKLTSEETLRASEHSCQQKSEEYTAIKCKELKEGLDTKIAEAVASIEAKLETKIDEALRLARDAATSTTLEDSVDKLSLEFSELVNQCTSRLATDMSDLKESYEEINKNVVSNTNFCKTIQQRVFDFSQEQAKHIETLEHEIRDELQGEMSWAQSQLTEARQHSEMHLDDVLKEVGLSEMKDKLLDVGKRTEALEGMAREIESVATRRVDWLIRDTSEILRSHELPVTYRSPIFEAAGHGDLQLELEAFGSAMSEQGDCQLRLWGCKGLHAIVKLSVGTIAEEIQIIFDGLKPCVMKSCWLRDAVDPQEGYLRLGVEILEGFRFLDLEKQGRLGKTAEKPESVKGMLRVNRYVCPCAPERIWDLQDQYDRLRSRITGRVEWRLEKAMLLQQSFPRGKCLCSALFSAGGVDGLQLIFYPSGDEEAKERYCSFYLCDAAGLVRQCFLSVGRQRRDTVRHQQRSNLIGRSSFCLFEGGIEKGSDIVELAVEIAEAQVHGAEAQKPGEKVVPLPDFGTAAAAPGEDAELGTSQDVSYAEFIENSSRLAGMTGRICVEDTKVLPRIWAPAPQLPKEETGLHLPSLWTYLPLTANTSGWTYFKEVPEGFRSLIDLPPVVAPDLGGRRPMVPQGPRSPSEAAPRPKPSGKSTPSGRAISAGPRGCSPRPGAASPRPGAAMPTPNFGGRSP